MKVHKGERIAVSADSRSMAILPFYLLKRHVFSRDHIEGDILINGVPKSDNFAISGLMYLHNKPLLPTTGLVYDICHTWREDLTF